MIDETYLFFMAIIYIYSVEFRALIRFVSIWRAIRNKGESSFEKEA